MFSMRVRPSVRDVGTRCLNICRRTHVWSRSRPRCGGGGGRRLGDGRATDVTFPLCRRAVREPALSEGDAPGGEPRRHDRAHQCKDNAASTDTPERERGDQACDARPRRALSAHAGSASDEDGRAPRALDAPAPSPGNEQRSAPRPGHRWSEPGDELAPRTLRRGAPEDHRSTARPRAVAAPRGARRRRSFAPPRSTSRRRRASRNLPQRVSAASPIKG